MYQLNMFLEAVLVSIFPAAEAADKLLLLVVFARDVSSEIRKHRVAFSAVRARVAVLAQVNSCFMDGQRMESTYSLSTDLALIWTESGFLAATTRGRLKVANQNK